MKILPIILLLTSFLISCRTSHQNNSEQLSSDSTHIDSISQGNEINAFIPDLNEVKIYAFLEFQWNESLDFNFIPLSDSYIFSEHPDSLIIEQEYLGMTSYENDNYHILSLEKRALFFKKTDIREIDSIYIYNVASNELQTYAVSQIPLIAFITPYGANGAVSQYDYQIGFRFEKSESKAKFLRDFVYIGLQNPYNIGDMEMISWEKISDEKFPTESRTNSETHRFLNQNGIKPIETFHFKKDGFNYFIQELGRTRHAEVRHLKVIETATNKLILDKVFRGSEGGGLSPLNDDDPELAHWQKQYAGKLFSGHPPFIFGFMYHSFGCPWISVVDSNSSEIYVRCDNRH